MASVADLAAIGAMNMLLLRRGTVGTVLALGALSEGWAEEATQRVEITGSAIKRAQGELPVPLEVVTREQIRRSGATSVNELLKAVAVIDIDDAGELGASGQPFASGTARARLRGLPDTQTLTLLDGRRVASNPFDDNSGAGAAFNINQIPIGAIERIEILKDGASAIYGADAVAGVVNVILRKDHVGVTVGTTVGVSSRGDARERRATLSAGFGKLEADGHHVLALLETFRRDALLRSERAISRTADFRRFGPVPGVDLDARGIFAPEGNVLSPVGTPTGETLRPCAPQNYSGNACRYDYNANSRFGYAPADRASALLAVRMRVHASVEALARVLHSVADDGFGAGPVPGTYLLPDGRRYAGLFVQGATPGIDRRMTTTQLELGMEGAHGATEWRLGASVSRAAVDLRFQGVFARTDLLLATAGDPTRGVPPTIDTTVTTNDPAVIDALRISPRHTGHSRIVLLDGQVSGPLTAWNGRTVRYATGLALWQEGLVNEPDPIVAAGGLFTTAARSAIRAERSAGAWHGELQVPLSPTIETQWALRWDGARDGSRVSPKLAGLWRPTPNWLLRASVADSFKRPTLKQLRATSGQRAINLTEAQCTGIGLPSGCARTSANLVTGANADLGPERGRGLNLGLLVRTDSASLDIDLWRVDGRDSIATPTIDEAISRGRFRFDPSLARWLIEQQPQNFARQRHAGVDLDARWQARGGTWGSPWLRIAATHHLRQARQAAPAAPWAEFNGTYGRPRWRAVLSSGIERGAWSGDAMLRATGGFRDTALPRQEFVTLPTGSPRRVHAHHELDLALRHRGAKGLAVAVAVKNVLDRMPPFSATNVTSNAYSQQGFAELYTARGRHFQLDFEYAF